MLKHTFPRMPFYRVSIFNFQPLNAQCSWVIYLSGLVDSELYHDYSASQLSEELNSLLKKRKADSKFVEIFEGLFSLFFIQV